MAKVENLTRFSDLSLILQYATKFGMDPDEVFWKVSFEMVINVLTYYKEVDEYHERYSHIWNLIHDDDNSSGEKSKS